MTWFHNIRMMPKLLGSFVVMALLAATVGGVGLAGLNGVQSTMDQMTGASTPGVVALLETQNSVNFAMRATRGEILASTPAKIADVGGDATRERAAAWQAFQRYQALPHGSAHETAVAARAEQSLRRWMALSVRVQQVAAFNTGQSDAAAIKLSLGVEADSIDALSPDLTELLAIDQQALTTDTARARVAHTSAVTILLVVVTLAALLAVALGVLIARSITRPLAEVYRSAESLSNVCMAGLASGLDALARGDLTVAAHVATTPPTHTSRDEIDQTAAVMRAIIARAQAAIGSYEEARATLREMIGRVASSSTQVDSGAAQLSGVSNQIGEASTQIARAIEEVARGASTQSQSASEALGDMGELSAAVTQVGAGAEAQAAAATQTEQAVSDLRATLGDATASVAAVTDAAALAAATAQEGGSAVSQTIASIADVRSAVQESASHVQALGQSSGEIGRIVAAIDDIASQTNLLALNAAIEAARAGEHGKGFTVVAAEVRKLAERAGAETKEITARIGAIQQRVADVITAMEAGSGAVEQSALLGEQARAALESILGGVAETNAQARAIGGAVTRMSGSVEAVDTASAHVAAVARQTVEATEHMRASAERVGAAIESGAAVSEQSAAGAEEVSASTQEQSAGVQEMAEGAQRLAEVSRGLREMVGRFVLDGGAAAVDARGDDDASRDNGRALRAA